MTSHQLIGSELTAFIENLPKGQIISILLHHPPAHYTAYVTDLQQQPELFKTNEPETCRTMGTNPTETAKSLRS